VSATPWLPPDFVHPLRLDLPTGEHLRPIRGDDVDLDLPAVMGSQPRLWSIFGAAWGWPPATMTREQDLDDLIRHEHEIAEHASFNYAMFDSAETRLLGCVYIDPPERAAADAEISWWVVDELVGSTSKRALEQAVPHWIATRWPFTAPRYIGHDLTWDEWLQLPGVDT
jgi:hypothetical protein